MNDRENIGVGVYQALAAGLTIFCLIGAFVLPPRLVFGKWIGCVGLVGFFVGIPIMMRVADRSRIRDAVETMGGQLIRMKRISEWWRRPRRAQVLGTKFEVVYVDLTGSTHRAMCRTGFIQGVKWLQDTVVGPEYLDS